LDRVAVVHEWDTVVVVAAVTAAVVTAEDATVEEDTEAAVMAEVVMADAEEEEIEEETGFTHGADLAHLRTDVTNRVLVVAEVVVARVPDRARVGVLRRTIATVAALEDETKVKKATCGNRTYVTKFH